MHANALQEKSVQRAHVTSLIALPVWETRFVPQMEVVKAMRVFVVQAFTDAIARNFARQALHVPVMETASWMALANATMGGSATTAGIRTLNSTVWNKVMVSIPQRRVTLAFRAFTEFSGEF